MFGFLMLLIEYVPDVIAGAAVITALTPTPRDDKIVGKIYKVVEVLGLNIGRAKDKAPRSKPKK